MPESLATLDGEAIVLDQAEAAFAAAMAAPAADRPGQPAPARKPPEPDPDPDRAPHGWTYVDGEWRPKKHPGRPRNADKSDRARTAESPRPAAGKPAAPSSSTSSSTSSPAPDFSGPLRDVAEALWFSMATAPIPDVAFGYNLRGLRTRLRVQAAIVEQNLDSIAAGANLIAQNNRFVRRQCERMAAGEGGLWIIPAATMLAPFIASTAQLWSGRLGVDEAQLEQIAAGTEQAAVAYMSRLFGTFDPPGAGAGDAA